MKKKSLAILVVLAAVVVAAVCIFAGVKRHGAASGAVPAAANIQETDVSEKTEPEDGSNVSKEIEQNVPGENSSAGNTAEDTPEPAEQTEGDDQTDAQEVSGNPPSSEEEQGTQAYDPAYTPGENESEEVPIFG